ncbi:hypothetical protein [Actinomyces ruminis]|uniref:Uncharacterized protein n=1 Tax=Actinomyces ruminis TaxID=1937003 RepID=A0ABX4MB73_9ACTO|nr:hypothetical protein [Actinomyces ruminis]PHP52576.1 hypothetical protein BW737_008820 [Actinomyces ruminis]
MTTNTTTPSRGVLAWEAPLRLAATDVLTGNNRDSRREKNRKTRAIRTVAEATARYRRAPHLNRARVVIDVDYPDRLRRDIHNLHWTVKPLVDGLIRAGLLPDDDDRHLASLILQPSGRLSPKILGQRTFTFHIHVYTPQETSS